MLLLAQMVTLRLITGDAVVSRCVGMTEDGCLEVLQKVLVLMGLMLAALLHSVDASALLVRFYCSFLFLLDVTVVLSKSLEVHPSETSLEVKAMLWLLFGILNFFRLNFFGLRRCLHTSRWFHCLIGH